MDFFNLTKKELEALHGQGGRWEEVLTELCKAILSNQGVAIDANLDVDIRTNVPDGGLDIVFLGECPNHHHEFLRKKTIIQAKAKKAPTPGEIKTKDGDAKTWKNFVKDELLKPKVCSLLKEGYQFVYAITDFVGPAKRANMTETLSRFIEEKTGVKGSKPFILDYQKLQLYVADFPGLALKLGKRDIAHVDPLEVRLKKERQHAPAFIETQSRKPIVALIQSFLSGATKNSLRIQGEAGVGKTRIVCEAAAGVDGSSGKTIYFPSPDNAVPVLQWAYPQNNMHLWVIVDECPNADDQRLLREIQGAENRIRLITLDKSGEQVATTDAESHIRPLNHEETLEVLESVHPGPAMFELRQTAAKLGGGYLRLVIDVAAYLKNNPGQSLDGLDLRGYLVTRFEDNEDHLALVDLIALFRAVGFKGPREKQLQHLLSTFLPSLSLPKAQGIIKKIKKSPGFVNIAGDYVYVTPEIVARDCFRTAWQQRIEGQFESIIEKLEPDLLGSLFERIQRSASDDIRDQVAPRFEAWLSKIEVEDLKKTEVCRKLADTAKILPEASLRVIRDLIDECEAKGLLGSLEEE